MDKVKKYFSKNYNWYSVNIQRIIFVVGVHFISSYIISLPYINIFAGLFSFLPYFFDWIAILILFKPKKHLILKVGLLLFAVSYPFTLIKYNFFLEIIGQASFFMIGTYIILSLREIRK